MCSRMASREHSRILPLRNAMWQWEANLRVMELFDRCTLAFRSLYHLYLDDLKLRNKSKNFSQIMFKKIGIILSFKYESFLHEDITICNERNFAVTIDKQCNEMYPCKQLLFNQQQPSKLLQNLTI